MPLKKKLIFCRSTVSASNIKRESRNGVEHIIITSHTLPPNVVMNRGFYPVDEVDKSFSTLERSLAPIEHPEVNGQFISAGDPFAINNFYGGAWNENVEKAKDGRIKIDKVINVQMALGSDKGKRLLDRITAMEDGTNTKPIHTSVGVYLEVDPTDEVMTNDSGDEYDWVARNMLFDHDAILLDSVGAATPSKGVGLGVNKEKMDVEFIYNDEISKDFIAKAEDFRVNAGDEMSFQDIEHELWHTLNRGKDEDFNWIKAIFNDTFVYETQSGEMFRSHYTIDEHNNLAISDTKIPVERVVTYLPINQIEDDSMDKIKAILKELGVKVNEDISDADLMKLYNETVIANAATEAADGDSDGDAEGAEEVNVNADLADTVKKQSEEIAGLKVAGQLRDDADLDKKIKVIQSSEKYLALNDATLKAIFKENRENFDKMYNESIPSYGIGPSTLQTSVDGDEFTINTDTAKLPE